MLGLEPSLLEKKRKCGSLILLANGSWVTSHMGMVFSDTGPIKNWGGVVSHTLSGLDMEGFLTHHSVSWSRSFLHPSLVDEETAAPRPIVSVSVFPFYFLINKSLSQASVDFFTIPGTQRGAQTQDPEIKSLTFYWPSWLDWHPKTMPI